MFENAGFKNVKYSFTNVVWDVYEVKDFFTRIRLAFVEEALANTTEKERKKFFDGLEDTVVQEVLKSKHLPIMNSLVIIGFK
jgi:hypothetical protein